MPDVSIMAGYSIFAQIHMSLVSQRNIKIFHPPLYPLPSREGRQKGDLTLLPSPLAGEG
jgi:hypothetical protein